MNREALFCDGTGNYVMPSEPQPSETVKFLFRTAVDDVDSVELYTGGVFYEMERADTVQGFDYYRIYREAGSETMRYCFRIRKGEEVVFYNQYGACDGIIDDYSFGSVPDSQLLTGLRGRLCIRFLQTASATATRRMM